MLQVPPGPGTQPAVGGVTETPFPSWGPPVETSMSLEDALAWMLQPRTGARLRHSGARPKALTQHPCFFPSPCLVF